MFNFDEIEIDYYRDADSSFEAFKAGLCDFRRETDAGRWMSSYDFPAVRDGRTVKESLPYGLPKGMEGFAFNMRRSIFADVRVREALGMMFDFEWINANFYGGLYRRSRSFFDDSKLASAGRPADAGERALLAAFPGAVRDDILEGRWEPPITDGSGCDSTMKAARTDTPWRSRLRPQGRCSRRADERPALRLRDPGTEPHAGTAFADRRTASGASAFTLPSASPMSCSTSAAAKNSISTC